MNCCSGCGGFADSATAISLGSGAVYCLDCFSMADSGAVRAKIETSQMLPRVSKDSPTNPVDGDLWLDPETGLVRVYIAGVWGVLERVEDGVAHVHVGPGRYFSSPLEPDPEPLTMWVIYKNPSDFAGRKKGDVYVLRRWLVGARESTPDRKVACFDVNLDVVREHVPPGLVCMSAGPDDDPTILETWF